ncbi:MAG TPA: tripartite tricarboxylate transporter substrate binding protein [Pseudolabrys sp.]|nr:tripartite tricarboxylate transporter substrate binding protein [Pseudolabrys sp.]
MRRRTVLGLAATSLATGLLPHIARGDTWPSRPVRFLCPSAAGGSLDILARLFGRGLSERLKQNFFVENRGGGGSNIGFDIVAKAPPDGYTIMVASDPLAVNVSIYENLSYDPIKDFAPIIMIATLSQVLAVNPRVPAKTFAEFVALARAKPNTLNVGSSGNGAPGHLACALLAQAGIPVVHVPYRGAGPAVLDAVAGQIDATIVTLPGTIAMIKAGQLRALAVSTSKRSRFLPDLPTMAEVVPGVVVDSWQAFFAPGGTPADIINRLNSECVALLQTKEVTAAFEAQAFEAGGGPPEALGKFLRDEIVRWAPIIKSAGIRA